ncbi:DUF551 domain-containing protein [Faucicola boevrei]|uniref:DUF551 domain-containing protein n=1 Tax=Faucicola boevrei TaxID=346665 RepID=UPI0003730772|nr:DUF551 domain-containing protein [Moraxella boevrei]
MFNFFKKKNKSQSNQQPNTHIFGCNHVGDGNVFLGGAVIQQSIRTTDKWVSVKDGLPNDEEICHIILKDGTVVYGVYSDEYKCFSKADNLTVQNGKYILDVCRDVYLDSVTNWRKLPNPPKGVRKCFF